MNMTTYKEWIKKAVTEDLQLNTWEMVQLDNILTDEDDDFEVWGDSSGWYVELELEDGYALVDSLYRCFTVFKDNHEHLNDRYLAEDMVLSVGVDEVADKYPQYAEICKDMVLTLDALVERYGE